MIQALGMDHEPDDQQAPAMIGLALAKLQLHNKAQLVRYALENDVAGDEAG